jgi:hypothetical protein
MIASKDTPGGEPRLSPNRDHLFWYEHAMTHLLRKGLIFRYLWNQNVDKMGERPMEFCLSTPANFILAFLGCLATVLVFALSGVGRAETILVGVFMGLTGWFLLMAIRRWTQCLHKTRRARQANSGPPKPLS